MNRPGSYGYPLKNVIEVGGGVCSYNFQIHLVFFFSQLRSVPYFGPSHTSVMFFAAIWLDHWATGDGSLCLDLRHVWKCMDVFF